VPSDIRQFRRVKSWEEVKENYEQESGGRMSEAEAENGGLFSISLDSDESSTETQETENKKNCLGISRARPISRP